MPEIYPTAAMIAAARADLIRSEGIILRDSSIRSLLIAAHGNTSVRDALVCLVRTAHDDPDFTPESPGTIAAGCSREGTTLFAQVWALAEGQTAAIDPPCIRPIK